MLKDRVKRYIEITGIPKSVFCKRLGFTVQSLYLWLKDERRFSLETEERIKNYLAQFNF